ncbi:MAG: winged helix-turn-helix transcriptional regulator [Erysipelotrichaceae bacterium]
MGKIKQNYSCSLHLTHDVIGGKWKLRILWHILEGRNRFSQMLKAMPDITHKMLITQLKEMEHSGILIREEHVDVRPHVTYALEERHASLIPVIYSLCQFGEQYANHSGIVITPNE